MQSVQKILKLISRQVGIDFSFVKILGDGYNNRSLLLRDPSGELVVARYHLDYKRHNPFIKIYYKYKRVRSNIILNHNLKNLPKEELTFIKKKYRSKNYRMEIQNLARDSSDEIYVPLTYVAGDFTFEEFCGDPLSNELQDATLQSKFAKDLGEFLAKLHNNFNLPSKDRALYKRLSAHLKLTNIYYRLNNWSDSTVTLQIQKNLSNSLKILENMGKSDEIRTILHNDIRKPNILRYSDDKLAIIDWDKAGIENVYNEFIQLGAYSNGLPLKFVRHVVDNYNKIANNKINLKKLKHLLIVNYVDECGWRSIIERKSRNTFLNILKNNVAPHLDCINKVFDENKEEAREFE